MKLKLIIHIILVAILISSCRVAKLKNDITGIWYFDTRLNNEYANNSGFSYSILFDFQKEGNVLIKYLSEKRDTVFKWNIQNDSLIFDNQKSRILDINKDSIVISYGGNLGYTVILKKAKTYNINKTTDEIKQILKKNIWRNNQSNATYEYFEDDILLLQNKGYDYKLKDTSINLNIDTWKVLKYDNFFFYYTPNNPFSNEIHQFINVNDSEFTISGNYHNKEIKFKTIKFNNAKWNKEDLIGKWICKNTNNKAYAIPYNENLKPNNRRIFFNGNLTFEFKEDELICKIDTFTYAKKIKWKLSKDKNSIILKYTLEDKSQESNYYSCAGIINLNDTLFTLKLFDNIITTTNERNIPMKIYLNLIQDFKKITNLNNK